jgi:hypothetical protein
MGLVSAPRPAGRQSSSCYVTGPDNSRKFARMPSVLFWIRLSHGKD